MNTCPNCGGDPDRPRWAPGGCACQREPEQQPGSGIDDILEAGSHWDYITPTAEATGANKYLLLVLAMAGTFGVILTKGILWG